MHYRLVTLLFLAALLMSDTFSVHAEELTLGTVNGQPLTLTQVQNIPIHQMWRYVYPVLKRRVMEVTIQKLGKTHPEFQFQVASVSDAEVRRLYEEEGWVAKGRYEEVREQLKGRIYWQKNQGYIESLYKTAQAKGLASLNIPAPQPLRVAVPFDPSRSTRKIRPGQTVVVEFFDFRCAHCQATQPTMQMILEKYSDLAIQERHYPNPEDLDSGRMASMAECVRLTSGVAAFRSFKKKLFAEPAPPSPQRMKAMISEAKIANAPDILSCHDQLASQPVIEQDMMLGSAMGMSQTPTFIIGTLDQTGTRVVGEVIIGALSLGGFEELVR